jgi:hypothetical protein
MWGANHITREIREKNATSLAFHQSNSVKKDKQINHVPCNPLGRLAASRFIHSLRARSFDSEMAARLKNCAMSICRSTYEYLAIRHPCAQFQMLSFSTSVINKF